MHCPWTASLFCVALPCISERHAFWRGCYRLRPGTAPPACQTFIYILKGLRRSESVAFRSAVHFGGVLRAAPGSAPPARQAFIYILKCLCRSERLAFRSAVHFRAPCISEGVLRAAPRHGASGSSSIHIHPEGFT